MVTKEKIETWKALAQRQLTNPSGFYVSGGEVTELATGLLAIAKHVEIDDVLDVIDAEPDEMPIEGAREQPSTDRPPRRATVVYPMAFANSDGKLQLRGIRAGVVRRFFVADKDADTAVEQAMWGDLELFRGGTLGVFLGYESGSTLPTLRVDPGGVYSVKTSDPQASLALTLVLDDELAAVVD